MTDTHNKIRALLAHGAVPHEKQVELYNRHGVESWEHPGKMPEHVQIHAIENPQHRGDDLGVIDFTSHDSVLHHAIDHAVKNKDTEMAMSIASRNKPEIQDRMFEEGKHFMIGPFNKGNPSADQLHHMHMNLKNADEKTRGWTVPDVSETNIHRMHEHTLKDMGTILGMYSSRAHRAAKKELELRDFVERGQHE